ncbi:hypothetical protein OO013_05145 [Mangrovivirga sp. M17]|uniref:Uncharacterized protein n=1 Tax=Mangrovivirga halotolerans TaxID=2993936 RepID=A0ABT3RN88_9BACT|nr:hypothetical protein [Mangrovivirga halotolerans]MCX2743239.1 hypothetical protein [Mangrovivirga halotolerans]
MGGFGSMDAANKSIKNNRSLLRKNSAWDKIKNYNSALRNKRSKFTDKTATHSQLSEIRERSLRENKRQIKKTVIKLILVGTAIIIAWWLLTENIIEKHNF